MHRTRPMTMHVDDRQILRRHRIGEAMQSAYSSRTRRGCVGQDSNLGTPSGRELEFLAFDLAWLPTRGRAEAAVRKTFAVSIDELGHQQRLFHVGRLRGRNGLPWYITSRELASTNSQVG